MSAAVAPASVEERHSDSGWVGLRARSKEWSMLTAEEALRIGEELVVRYGPQSGKPATPA